MKRIKKRVPEIRFPSFVKDWEVDKIGNLFVFKNGLNKEKEYFGSGTPIINFKDVFHNNYLDSSRVKGLVNVSDQEKLNFSAKKGDVFFTRTSESINEIGMASVLMDDIEDCVFSGFVLRARPTSKVLTDGFKKYCFSTPSIRKEIVTKSSYTTRALTSGTLLSKVLFSFPPTIDEQTKISTFFESLDHKIDYLSKKTILLENYRRGVIQRIFSQEIRFKDHNNKQFESWGKFEIGTFMSHKSTRNKDLEVTRVLSVNNKKGFIRQQEQFENHVVASKDLSNYKIVLKDDYAYNPSRINVGSIARLKNYDNGIVSPMYTVFGLKGNVLPEFFDLLIQTHYFKHLIKIGSSGSVRNTLNFEDMSQFVVKIPQIEEQQKIVSFINALDDKIYNIKRQYHGTYIYRKSLMHKMFI